MQGILKTRFTLIVILFLAIAGCDSVIDDMSNMNFHPVEGKQTVHLLACGTTFYLTLPKHQFYQDEHFKYKVRSNFLKKLSFRGGELYTSSTRISQIWNTMTVMVASAREVDEGVSKFEKLRKIFQNVAKKNEVQVLEFSDNKNSLRLSYKMQPTENVPVQWLHEYVQAHGKCITHIVVQAPTDSIKASKFVSDMLDLQINDYEIKKQGLITPQEAIERSKLAPLTRLKRYRDCPKCDLSGVSLLAASLHSANLRGANLKGASFDYTDFRNADFRNANLVGADLSFAKLQSSNFMSADLQNVNLGGANLGNANLQNANLESARIGYADLRGANFSGANLRNAGLSYAKLQNTDFRNANLEGANFTGANYIGADFTAAKTRGAIGLEIPSTPTARPATTVTQSPVKTSMEKRLRELKKLLDSGLITPDEAAKKREDILNSL